jgi:hypothetical protein
MLKNFTVLLASLLLLNSSACKKGNEYPLEPDITFKSLTTDKNPNGTDAAGHLTISFTDGDGDLGLDNNYTSAPFNVGSPYYYNMVVVYYEKDSSGVWHVVTPSNITFSGRFPFLTPEGKNKALRGDIAQQIPLSPGAVNLHIKFDVFIYDRALHHSNTVTSSELIINTN